MSASATRSFLLSSNSRVIKRVVSFCCSSASCEQRGELWRDFYLRHKAAQKQTKQKVASCSLWWIISLSGGTNSSRLSSEICSCVDSETNSRRPRGGWYLSDACHHVGRQNRLDCILRVRVTQKPAETNKQTSEQVPTETREKSLNQNQNQNITPDTEKQNQKAKIKTFKRTRFYFQFPVAPPSGSRTTRFCSGTDRDWT